MKYLGLLAFLAAPAFAQDAEIGADLYLRHCATCHGLELDGRGPMASALLVQPTNLRALAANNDGVFPTARVVYRIDGRDPLVSHGSDMPVWGPFFDETQNRPIRTPAGQPILTTTSIADLVVFLESVQD